MQSLSPTARQRVSPFYQKTLDEGVVSFSPYNGMLMPTGYGDPQGEYERLMTGVSMWDVSVERQVQLEGPDAAKLAQALCPRDISKCVIGQGKYVPICNHAGTVINDPILLKLSETKFWLSIADSNIWYWAGAIAAERGLDVAVTDPGVSPLAVQGPMAENVIASIFGDWVRDLKYFWFKETQIEGIPVAVARSGWSKQGGFEIYLMDEAKGEQLWDIVKAAGQPWNIGPGCPNSIERVESGLLSWGSDTDEQTNPYEIRMGKYVDLNVSDDVVGIKALRKIKAQGIKRHQLGVVMDGDAPLPALGYDRPQILHNGEPAGMMTCMTFSPRLGKNIGFALVNRTAKPGATVEIALKSGRIKGSLQTLPFF